MRKLCVYCIVLLTTIFFPNSHKAQLGDNKETNGNIASLPMTCEELIDYRDRKLFKDFSSAFAKYQLNVEAKKDLLVIKENLLSEKASWYEYLSTESASSDLALVGSMIAQTFKTLSDKYEFILTISKSTVETTVKYSTKQAEYWYNVIKSSKSLQKAVAEDAEKEGYRLALSKGNEVTKSIKAVWDFCENLSKFSKIDKDHGELKKELKRLLDLIDENYSKYEQAANDESNVLNHINTIKSGIDKYLKDQKCGEGDQIEQFVKERLPKNAVVNSMSEGQFIFLTAEISEWVEGYPMGKWQTLRFISDPILVRESIESLKQKFTMQAELQFPQKKELIRKYLGQDQGSAIKVYDTVTGSGKSYTNVQECNEGRDAYIRETERFYSIKKLNYTQVKIN